MRALRRPKPEHIYDPQTEIDNLIQHRDAVPAGLKSKVKKIGVFDFDSAVFADIYNSTATAYWRCCAKYYISDHRPLWMQLEL